MEELIKSMNNLIIVNTIFTLVGAFVTALVAIIAWFIMQELSEVRKENEELKALIRSNTVSSQAVREKVWRIQEKLKEIKPDPDPNIPLKREENESSEDFLKRLMDKIAKDELSEDAIAQSIKQVPFGNGDCGECEHLDFALQHKNGYHHLACEVCRGIKDKELFSHVCKSISKCEQAPYVRVRAKR